MSWKKLNNLNKVEEIDNPELFFEFKPNVFIPQKIIVSAENIYLFSPYSNNVFKLDKNKKENLLPIDKKFSFASNLDDSILLFSKPNQLTTLMLPGTPEEKEKFFSFSLKDPYPDFNFNDFSSFKGNLYFLDEKAGKIIKYPYKGNLDWGEPEVWLNKAENAKSIAVSGSIWVLKQDNSIDRYYAGALQEKLKIDIFPEPKYFTNIFINPLLPYLYILESSQKRIIILSRSGEIIKQFQSEKFDNLLDFSVSNDGKEVYLLNGLKVYRIEN